MAGNTLPSGLRKRLEKTIGKAREVAEEGARDAIRRFGVAEASAPSWLDDDRKALRRRLRAHARSLGDTFDRGTECQEVEHLVGAAAYAHWHRMLFARFLAERDLLRHPEHDVAVSLADCDELAVVEGLPDRWAVAERYAAAMLPAVFVPEDPVLSLELAPEHAHRLQALVQELDREIFQASDSLGWTYQFWRAAEKKRVNDSGVKIGADELPAVTQLFTEPYMVRFLLHNTLGAWWAGKILSRQPDLAKNAPDEAALRAACALPGIVWDMLRFVRENDVWRPAAGTFPGWPTEAKAITLLDPCCGSGHFLTEALPILAALRQAEEGLSAGDAVAAVLEDNLFGLEIDGRCVQIAAFAVAINAWAIGGWQSLPRPHIAWVGAPPPLSKQEFKALAEGDSDLEAGLAALHDLFSQAPILGSLIEPTGGDLMSPQRLGRIEPLLDKLLNKARRAEPEAAEGAIAARGMADAAQILGRRYVLQVTNVPFLGRGKQSLDLVTFSENGHNFAKQDLATVMLSRISRMSCNGGTVAAVSPQNWHFLGSYKEFRRNILENCNFNCVAVIGENGFESAAAAGAFVALTIISALRHPGNEVACLSAVDEDKPQLKLASIKEGSIDIVRQVSFFSNADSRISFGETSDRELLSKYASSYVGFQNGDTPRWVLQYWERLLVSDGWVKFQWTSDETSHYDGRHCILKWDSGRGELSRSEQCFIKGTEAWRKRGVIIRHMRHLPAGIYDGDMYDQSSAVIVPKDEALLPAIWTFCSSPEFNSSVRNIDRSIKVTNATLVKIPFDVEKWKRLAEEKYPCGLPQPYSDDPTQWLFHGHPARALPGTVLHVALARLSGYRWPAEGDTEIRLAAEARELIAAAAQLPYADEDGVLCVPPVAGKRPLAERLRVYLVAVFGSEWSDAMERQLVADADEYLDKKVAKDLSIEGWLRDRAFRQHCKLFHDRPFLWQVWDGMKDGFSAFLHYHRLDQATLRKLTYTILNDWLARAKAEGNVPRQEKGRELQQQLEKILEGENPYDIFVRWKSLARQPLGWDPDLDDGVRMNIRPFVTAGILRDTPNIKWGKDRGGDVASAPWYDVHNGERINDHHTTLAEKRAARGEES